MSAPVRFLGVVTLGWVAARAFTMGAFPAVEEDRAPAPAAPPEASAAPPLPPPMMSVPEQIQPADSAAYYSPPYQGPDAQYGAYGAGYGDYPGAGAAGQPQRPIYTYYVPYPAPPRIRFASLPAPPGYGSYAPEPAYILPPASRRAEPPFDEVAASAGYSTLPPLPRDASPVAIPPAPAAAARLDRVQLTMWTLLRGPPGPGTLASGGTLGGSQAGARFSYNFGPRLGLSFRSSSPIGGSRGGEVAAGLRYRPLQSIPVAVTLERRQALGRFSTGRSAFALFTEGGVYQRPMPWHLQLDGYAQAGVVGWKSRDWFADGGFTLTRPLMGPVSIGGRPMFGQLSAGLGLWGGAQPGIYRVDAGPRLSARVRRNVAVHLDWRRRVAGSALPDSGPALTLAGDF